MDADSGLQLDREWPSRLCRHRDQLVQMREEDQLTRLVPEHFWWRAGE